MRRLLLWTSKHFAFTRILRHHYVVIRNQVLWLRQSIQPIKRKTVVFQAYDGLYTCSPKALYKQMLLDERFSGYSFIWVVKSKENYELLEELPRTTIVIYRSKEYYKAFALAGFWIVNSMLPLRIVKRKGQVMVQCWHGTPLKRLRNDIIENTKNAMNSRQDFVRKNLIDSRRYDYLLSPSDFATEKFISAFGLGEEEARKKIVQVGYPRNDALRNVNYVDIVKARNKLKLPHTKKVLLYAPTWRDDQHDVKVGYTHENELDFDSLQERLGGDFIVLFRAHYMIANTFDFSKYEGFVYDVSHVDDINELYIASDALITDYSSVMFDFANLGRPMLFYMYDRDHYEKQLRGFYIDLEELPGEIITNQARLEKCLAELESYEKVHREQYKEFTRRFTPLDDGRAAARLISSVFDPPLRRLPYRQPSYSLRRYQPIMMKSGIK